MNKTKTTMILAAAFLAATAGAMAQRGAQSSVKPKPAAAKSALPSGAVKIGENKWRYKDPAGKTWLYFATPFGYSRTPEADFQSQAANQAEPAGARSSIRVTAETADSVTFEMPGPVGVQRWSRKKSELTADEQRAYSGTQRKNNPPQTAQE